MIAAATLSLLLLLALIFCRKPMWGLYAVIATMPFEWIGSWAINPKTGHPVVNLAEIAAAAWLIGLAYAWARKKVVLQKLGWPWWWLVAFMVWSAVSAAHIGRAPLFESFVVVILLFATATAIAVSWPNVNIDRVIDSLFGSAGLVCCFGVYQFIMGTFRILDWSFLRAPYIRDLFGFPRIHSVALEPLYFANYLLVPLLVGLALVLLAPRRMRRWHRLVLALVGVDFLLTMSRGAILSLIPALALLAFGIGRMHGVKVAWKKVVGGAAAVILVCILAVGAASYVATKDAAKGWSNFASELTVKLFATGSFYDRESQSSLGLRIARRNWLMGVGLEGVTPYVRGYNAPRRPNDVIALNNQAVELLAETGIVGTVLFYIFLVGLGIAAWRTYLAHKARELAALHLGLVVTLVAMTIQAQSFTGFFLMPYWIVYGLLLALSVQQSRTGGRRNTRSL